MAASEAEKSREAVTRGLTTHAEPTKDEHDPMQDENAGPLTRN